VPNTGENVINEELLYSCKFWIDHIAETKCLEPSLEVSLSTFLSNYIIPWMEVVTSKGQFQDLSKVREWLQVSISCGVGFMTF